MWKTRKTKTKHIEYIYIIWIVHFFAHFEEKFLYILNAKINDKTLQIVIFSMSTAFLKNK